MGVMKKRRKLLALLLIVSTVLLSACFPPAYTSGAKKAVKADYKANVQTWFKANMPKARVTSYEAFVSGNELYRAISGSYSVKLKSYDYLYDVEGNIMYVSERDEDVKEIIAQRISEYYGFDENNVKVSIQGHDVSLTSANDQPDELRGEPKAGERTSAFVYLLPYDMSAEEIADSMLYDEEPLALFNLDVNVDVIPDYNPAAIRYFSGLNYISFYTPSAFEGRSLAHSTQYRDMALNEFMDLRKINDTRYVGYMFEEKIRIDEAGVVTDIENDHNEVFGEVGYENLDDNTFLLAIPEKARPVLFGKSTTYTYCFYTSSSGTLKEVDFSSRSRINHKAFPGYDLHNARYILPESNLYYYEMLGRRSDDGTYTIKFK